jgi:hypothetical protein
MSDLVRISLSDLPARSRGLSGSELERVFGGCRESGACQRNEECCRRVCYMIPGDHSGIGNCRRIG